MGNSSIRKLFQFGLLEEKPGRSSVPGDSHTADVPGINSAH